MMQKAIDLLRKYSGKKYNHLTQRGNKSILLALKIAKSLGKKKLIIQDQGGWITYPQYGEKLGFEVVEVKTDYGLIVPNELAKELDSSCVVLVNSLSGYFAEQPIGLINAMVKQKEALLINDASGSIGTENAKFGDIVICSFGEGKPINLEYGGFIAFDEKDFDKPISDDFVFDSGKINELIEKINLLPEKLRLFEKHAKQIKKDLADMDILHKDSRGINVVIKFKNNFEMERIVAYCNKRGYEYTECPRYIRVNVPAISIEVKRLKI